MYNIEIALFLLSLTQTYIFSYLVFKGMRDYKELSLQILLISQVLAENVVRIREDLVSTQKVAEYLQEHGFMEVE